MGPCIVSIFQNISNKMQRYTVYLYLEIALHVSGGTYTHYQERIQLSTASGICHTVTATCCYRGRVGTGLSVLWVAYATHSTLKPVPALPRQRQVAVTVLQIPNAVGTVVCAPDDGWNYHPKHVEQFPDINKLCNVASCWIYIGILLGAHYILHISRISVNY